MYKTLLKYAIGIGLNRGFNFLLLPILPNLLGIVDYGLYNLTQLTAQLLVPVIGLSGSTAILREGATDVELGSRLNYSFSNTSLVLGLIVLLGIYISDATDYWVLYAVAICIIEILFLNTLTLYRAKEFDNRYLIISILKSIGFLSILLFLNIRSYNLTLANVLNVQLIWYSILGAFVLDWKNYLPKIEKADLKFVLPYTLVLIPHSAFQWIMNNIDKYIIQGNIGDIALGEYSIIYNISMIFLVLNSGIALTLPQIIFKNYDHWLKSSVRANGIKLYSLAAFVISTIILALVFLELKYLHLTGTTVDVTTAMYSSGLLLSGFYCYGIYMFYGNFILYQRKAKKLTFLTMVGAGINVILNLLLIPKFGLIGAAATTLLTYLTYTLLVVRLTPKIEKDLQISYGSELSLMPATLICIMTIASLILYVGG